MTFGKLLRSNLNFRAKHEESFRLNTLQKNKLRRQEPDAGARREKGQASKPRARGWRQTRKRPSFDAESQRLEPDAKKAKLRRPEPKAGARREKGQAAKPRAIGWSQTRKRPRFVPKSLSNLRKRPRFVPKKFFMNVLRGLLSKCLT